MLGGCSVTQRGPTRRWTRLNDYGPDARNRVVPLRLGRRRSVRSHLPLWIGAILAGLAIGSGAVDELLGGERQIRASAAATTTASFGFCHQGGGSNCVVDGDTFYLGGEKVRIAGIDAPETHPSRCDREEELGSAATMRLQQLLNGGSVRLVPIDRDRDRYGRLLRNVEVNGRDVGETLVAEGIARPYAGGRRSWCD